MKASELLKMLQAKVEGYREQSDRAFDDANSAYNRAPTAETKRQRVKEMTEANGRLSAYDMLSALLKSLEKEVKDGEEEPPAKHGTDPGSSK